MKWIKAIERLPEKRGKYWIKFNNHKGQQKTGSIFDGFKFPHHQCEIEWLDEDGQRTPADDAVGGKVGEWQLCPKCNGSGQIQAGTYSTVTFLQCDVCNGAKILAKPIVTL